MVRPLLSLALGSCLAFSVSLKAADFTSADALFAKRSESLAAALAAKEKYKDMLPTLSSDKEKIYAIAQMSRIDLYVGGMMAGVPLDKKDELLEDCMNYVEQIAATKSQEYYFHHLACLAVRGKQATSASARLKYALKMRNIQNAALESTKDAQGQLVGGYEGGGILRVIAAVRANPKAKPLGLYNAKEAVEFAQTALETESKNVPPFGDLSGRDYVENYYYLGFAEVNQGLDQNDKEKVEQGKATVEKALEKIADGETPAAREPETKYYEGELSALKAALDDCLDKSDWNTCLVGKLS